MKKLLVLVLISISSMANSFECGIWKNMAVKNAKTTSKFLYEKSNKCSFKSLFEIYLSHKSDTRFPNNCYEMYYRATMLGELSEYSKGCE